MKNAKKLLALLLALVMLFALCACSGDKKEEEKETKSSSAKKDKKDTLVGEWVMEEEGVTLTLKNGGTGSMGADGMTLDLEWESTKTELTLVLTAFGETEEQTFEYELDGDELILVDESGEETLWIKGGKSSSKPSSKPTSKPVVKDDELTDAVLEGDWDVTMDIGALMVTGMMGDMSEITGIIDPEELDVQMELEATFEDGELTLHSMDMPGLYDDMIEAMMDWMAEGDNLYEFLAAVEGSMTAAEYKEYCEENGVSKKMLLAAMEAELPSAEDAGVEDMDEVFMDYELDGDEIIFDGGDTVWVVEYSDDTIYVLEMESDGETVVLNEGDFVLEKQ